MEDHEHSEYLKVNYSNEKKEDDDNVKNENFESSAFKKSRIEYSTSNKIDEDSKEYENSPNPTRKSNNRKKSIIKEGYYTKLVKKDLKSEDPLETWKNINIKEVLPDAKLNSIDVGRI